jgi:hypothetical protein
MIIVGKFEDQKRSYKTATKHFLKQVRLPAMADAND